MGQRRYHNGISKYVEQKLNITCKNISDTSKC